MIPTFSGNPHFLSQNDCVFPFAWMSKKDVANPPIFGMPLICGYFLRMNYGPLDYASKEQALCK
jgi:hypothetical protein